MVRGKTACHASFHRRSNNAKERSMSQRTKVLSATWAFIAMSLSATVVGAQTQTARIVVNANAFLGTLDQAQRQRVLFAFNDEEQRKRWSNFPTFFKRAGLNLGELNTAQRTAVMTLLSSALSARGYGKVQQIVEADEILKTNERNATMFGKELYFVSILGTPSETAPWML